MAFVVEKIVTREQRAEFGAFQVTYPDAPIPLEARSLVVDRDRDLYFIGLGGGVFERPFFFRLVSKNGITVSCEARYEVRGKHEIYPDGLDIVWNVSLIQIPKVYATRSEEIVGWIREAFLAYGYLANPELTKSTAVNMPSPKFL